MTGRARYLATKIAQAAVTRAAVATFNFLLFHLLPGDPIRLQARAGRLGPEDIARLKALYGLDLSLPEQFLVYLRNLVTGNLGTSFTLKRPVADILAERIVNTVELLLLATVLVVIIGIVIGSSKLAYDVAYPLLVGFSSIPKVAVVPIFVVWFGSGTVPAILTAMVICIFPVVVNVATGLATTEPELEDVLKVLGASKWDVLWNVGLPRALPYFFASLKIAITLAFVGSVLSETVAANKGIGNVMMIASGNFDVTLVFAGLFILALLGVTLYAISSFIEARMTGWTQRKNDMAMG